MSCTPRHTTTIAPELRAAALSWMAGRLAWERTLDRIRSGREETAPQAPAREAA